MEGGDWKNGATKAMAVRLSGEAGLMHLSERGEQEMDDTFLLLINASHESIAFKIPTDPVGARWEELLNTAADMADEAAAKRYAAGRACPVAANSLHLLMMHGPEEV
jgi:glycogen operon protein